MFSISCLFIFVFEVRCILMLYKKYTHDNEDDISSEEFIARATLEDIIRVTFHQHSSFLVLGLLTIKSALNIWS